MSWGSRRFYRWTLGADGRVTNAARRRSKLRTLNPSHYVDYQDCKYAGGRRMLCTGVTEFASRRRAAVPPRRDRSRRSRRRPAAAPGAGAPVDAGGLDMTHNPVWIEATAHGLRGYFMPEDDRSTIYIYDVTV